MKFIAPYNVEGVENGAMSELMEWLDTVQRAGFDIETIAHPEYLWYKDAGLDPYTSEISMVQIGDKESQFVIDARYEDATPVIQKIKEKNIRIVGTNLKFDYKHILHKFGIRLNKLYDTMLSEMILTCGATTPKGFYGLRGMSERYLDIQVDKEIREEFRDWGYKPFTKEQIEYGARDVVLPLYIAKKQLDRIKATQLGNCIKLEHEFLPALAEIELKGFYLDIDLWLENEEKYHHILDEQESKLKSLIPDIDINWNSPKQVAELFDEIGIPVLIIDQEKSTESKTVRKHSVGKIHLNKYSKKYPIVKEYLEYKELKKLVSSYGEKFLRHVNPVSGRVHTTFYQILDTGRISSSGPNLQNIPNEEKRPGFRNCFIGNLIVADYSAQEGRILADRAKEPAMIDFFLNGDGDIHSFVGRNMFKCEVSKTVNPHLRQQGKITNFTIAYGGGAHKIADTFQIPIAEAKKLIDMYYTAFPALKEYFKREQEQATRAGYILIDNVTNRRSYNTKFLHLKQQIDSLKAGGQAIPPSTFATYKRQLASMERNAQNYPIQGTGGSMTKLAATYFWQWTIKEQLDNEIFIVNLVHDEIVIECTSAAYLEMAANKIQECMEMAGAVFVSTLPMPANPEIVNYWKH